MSNQDQNKDQNQKKFNVWALFAVLFFVAALVFLGFFIKTMIDQKNRADQMSGLVSTGSGAVSAEPISTPEVTAKPEETTDPSAEATPEPTPEPEDPWDKSVRLITEAGIPIPDLEVDLQNLRETVNKDIYAWIYVPGTKVNYPVLQHETDDTYYLNYNLDGSKGYPGCIYTEKKYNSKDFTDANTVLYGHNMKNGTMFGSIHRYEDEDFFNENRYIYVYTDERLLCYKIFAAYEHSNQHLLFNNDFEDTYSFCYYFKKVQEGRNMHRIFADDVELTGEGQHVITLSTCINNKPDNRYLVQGVLVNEE